jgi:hypothetical protein
MHKIQINQRKTKFMKAANTKLGAISPTPVFQKMHHRLRPNPKVTAPDLKPQKRDNIFSKSRDTHEDRGTREMKTSHNTQTFPH